MKTKLYYFAVLLIVGVGIVASILIYKHHGANIGQPAVSSHPAVGDIQENLKERGEVMYRKQMYVPLIETYKKMLEQLPDNVEVKKKLAFAYFGATLYDDAKPILFEVSKSPAADAEVFYELGFIAKSEGNTDAALEFLKRALELNSGHIGAMEMLK